MEINYDSIVNNREKEIGLKRTILELNLDVYNIIHAIVLQDIYDDFDTRRIISISLDISETNNGQMPIGLGLSLRNGYKAKFEVIHSKEFDIKRFLDLE